MSYLTKKLFIFSVALLALCHFSYATESDSSSELQQLEQFIKYNQGATATFNQKVISINQNTQQETKVAKIKKSSGTFSFLRPNLFRFSYQKPFKQEIVSDGSYLWTYDVDLEQASKQSYQSAINNSALALLINANDLADLSAEFNIGTIAGNEYYQGNLVELVPKNNNQQLSRLLIGINQTQIKHLQIENSFGQISILDFTYPQQSNLPPKSAFKFTLPPNVDLVDNVSTP